MTKRINEISAHENFIRRFESECDKVFHWVIAILLLSLFAGLFMYGTTIGWACLGLAGALFVLVLVPFYLVKLFSTGEDKLKEHLD